MAITIERNQKIQSLQIIDNIYIYIYFFFGILEVLTSEFV